MIVVGEIDLSFGYMYGLAATLVAGLLDHLGLADLGGDHARLRGRRRSWAVQRLLVTSSRSPSFIVTLGTASSSSATLLVSTNASTLNPVYPPDGKVVPQGEIAFFGLSTRDLPHHSRCRASG